METLDQGGWLDFIASAEELDEKFFNFSNPSNITKARIVWNQILKLQTLTCPVRGTAKAGWTSKRSVKLGRRFEAFFRLLFERSKIFTVHSNVSTESSELDLLIELSILSQRIPFLAGHALMIGEAKCHVKAPSVQWVARLGGIMDTHTVKISILITACSSRNLNSRAKSEVHAQAIRGRPILLIGQKQIGEMLAGRNLLSILKEQYRITTTRQSIAI